MCVYEHGLSGSALIGAEATSCTTATCIFDLPVLKYEYGLGHYSILATAATATMQPLVTVH